MLKRFPTVVSIAALWISTFACRPIIAIGWPELIILTILIAILLGPLLFRLYRFIDKVQKANRSEEKRKK
jgi:hypothetical protein